MEVKMIFIWVCFIFCLGLTSGGVLILFRNKKYKQLPSFQYLQYYLILVYTFGFYSMWSKVFFQLFFTSGDSFEKVESISNLLIMLGIPFLVIGKLMFVFWSLSLLKKKLTVFVLPAVFIIIFLIVLVYLTYVRFNILLNIRQLYAVFVISVVVFIIATLLFSEIDYLSKRQKMNFLLLIIFSGLVYTPLFFRDINQSVLELVFMFLFFLSHTAIGVYFVYSARLPFAEEEDFTPVSFESFIKKYSISSREAEIAQHIYHGRTNKEIADKLFVTVQTIKDHTHRIYQKADVKSRAQLTSLMRKFF